MPFFTFSKAVHWFGLECLLGSVWPVGLMFVTPDLDQCRPLLLTGPLCVT